MALHSLGKITVVTAGTPIQTTTNVNNGVSTFRQAAHSFMVEVLAANTGKVYVGIQTMNRTTLAGVFAVLAAPTTNILPTFTATVSFSAASFNMADIWLDVDNSGEGALVSIVIA